MSEGLFGLAEYTFLGSEVRHWGHVGSLRRRADRIVKETCCGPDGSERCKHVDVEQGEGRSFGSSSALPRDEMLEVRGWKKCGHETAI